MEIVELGHIVLFVRNREQSRRVYGKVLGWNEPARLGPGATVFTSGRTHHELLLLEVGEEAAPIQEGRRVGMFHFGLKVGESDDDLRDVLEQLRNAEVPILRAADQGVVHSLFIEDSDGNQLELYIDVQPALWKEDPSAVGAPPQPLHL